LEKAVRIVAAGVAGFRLRQTIEIVAHRLATSGRFEPQSSEGGDV